MIPPNIGLVLSTIQRSRHCSLIVPLQSKQFAWCHCGTADSFLGPTAMRTFISHQAHHGNSRSMPRSVLSQNRCRSILQPPADITMSSPWLTIWCPLLVVFAQTRIEVSKLKFHVRVSMTIATKVAPTYPVPCTCMLLTNNRPHQPDLSRSGSNSTNTRLLESDLKMDYDDVNEPELI